MKTTFVRKAYGALLGILVISQIVLRANPILLLSMTLIGTFPFLIIKRTFRPTDVLFLVFTFYYAVGALITKTWFGQPLQSNLKDPVISGSYLFVGFMSITLGYMAANFLSSTTVLFPNIESTFDSNKFLNKMATPLFLLGAMFDFLHAYFRRNAIEGAFDTAGFGGFGSFHFIFLAGLAAQAVLWGRDAGVRSRLIWLMVFGATSLILSAAENVKKPLIEFVLIVGIAVFCCRVRLRPGFIIIGTFLLAVTLLYVQPLIIILRPFTSTLSPVERITKSVDVLVISDFDPLSLARQADKVSEGYSYSFNGSYLYPKASSADRFSMVAPIDAVASNLDASGTMGVGGVIEEISHILPSFIVSKSDVVTADMIAWHYGYRQQGVIARPVIGLVASSIAAYGLLGAIFLPGMTIFFAFSIINVMAGPLRNSAWSCFILVVCLYLTEKELAPVIAYFFRDIPLTIGSIAAITWFYRGFLRGRRAPARAARSRPSLGARAPRRRITPVRGAP